MDFHSFLLKNQAVSFRKELQNMKGIYDFYHDENTDKLFLQIETLDTEFLYVRSLSEGIGSNDIGLDRGQLGDGVVVSFKSIWE